MRFAMYAALWCFISFVFPGAEQSEAADDIVMRTSLAPESSALVGQRVILNIDVLGKDGWAKLKSSPRIEVDGTVVYVPAETGSRLNETIDGESYSGTRTEIWLYPQRTGEIQVPPLQLPVVNQVFGATDSSGQTTLTSESLRFTAVATAGDGSVTVADSMTVTQSWSEQPEVLRVGDGISREIVRKAQGIPSLLIKPVDFTTESDLRLIGDEPESSNKLNRGQLTAQRTDRATYIFTEPGEVLIPDVVVSWIDVRTGGLQTETLEGLRITVTDIEATTSQNSQPDAADSTSGSWLTWGLITVVACLILVVAVATVWWRNRASFQEFIRGWHESERAGFRRFCQASGHGHPTEVVRLLYAWWGTFKQPEIGIREWLTNVGSQSSVELLNELERSVECTDPRQDLATQLAREVTRARKVTHAAARLRTKPVPLPPLR